MIDEPMMAAAPGIRLRRGSEVGDLGDRQHWLLCRSKAYLFGLPLERVNEIMRVLPIKAVSGAPLYVRGLCTMRGEVVPVVDSGVLLSGDIGVPERMVAVAVGARTVALTVEGVLGVRRIAAEQLVQLPPILQVTATETIDSIGSLDEELLFCLNAARIVPEDLLDQLDGEDSSL